MRRTLLDFALDANLIGLNVALVNLGTFIGGPFAGTFIDWVGRKKGLLVGNLIGIVAVIIQASAINGMCPLLPESHPSMLCNASSWLLTLRHFPTETMLLVGRVLLGISLTFTGVTGPSLVVEATPAKLHHLLTNAITMAMPIFGTIISGASISVYESTTEWGWRGAMLGELGGPILGLLCLPFVPESPRWLISKGRNTEARYIVNCMHPSTDPDRDAAIEIEFNQIVQTIEFERQFQQKPGFDSWKSLVATASDRRRFLIAVCTNVFFQITGANTFPYFFTLLLQGANITDPLTTLYINLGLCIWGTISVALGIWACQRIGSKTSLLWSAVVMTVCLVLLAILTALENGGDGNTTNYGIGAVAVIFLFQLAGFGSWMILTYAYPPQILRYTHRANGFALSMAIGYGVCIMMTYILPLALERLGWRFYAINAGWNVLVIFVIWLLFVETKGTIISLPLHLPEIHDHSKSLRQILV